MKLANILLARRQPNGRVLLGVYLTDLGCLGVKNTFSRSLPLSEYGEMRKQFIERNDAQSCPVELAHQIIYGAVDYAAALDFRPHRDFALTKHLLNDRGPVSPNSDLEFGQDGKPFLVTGPNDYPAKLMKHLEAKVGKGNFYFMAGGPAESWDSEDGEDVEWDDAPDSDSEEEEEWEPLE